MTLPPWVAVGNTSSGKTTLLDRMTLQLNKSRFGSNIDYDIAILVLDITFDLQPETIQSINLLQILEQLILLTQKTMFEGRTGFFFQIKKIFSALISPGL